MGGVRHGSRRTIAWSAPTRLRNTDAESEPWFAAGTGLSVTGVFLGFTYVVEFLTRVNGISDAAVTGMLFVYGLAGIVGVTAVGPLLDGLPRGVLVLTVGVQAAALLGLYLFAESQPAVVALVALLGCSSVPVFMATQARILHVAPGRTEIGFAANSAAFNVGIAAGALLGGVILSGPGVRTTFLIGAVLTVVPLIALVAEPLLLQRNAGQDLADVKTTAAYPTRPRSTRPWIRPSPALTGEIPPSAGLGIDRLRRTSGAALVELAQPPATARRSAPRRGRVLAARRSRPGRRGGYWPARSRRSWPARRAPRPAAAAR